MPRHLLAVLAVGAALVFSTAMLFSWLSVHLRLPVIENILVKMTHEASQKTEHHVANNLQLMATRLGELQARVLQLDADSERVAALAGIRRQPVPVAENAGLGGQGGVYVPAPMSVPELAQEIERLTRLVAAKTDDLGNLERQMLDKRVRDRLLPTMMPVKDAALGSSFGTRADPFNSMRAMHEGLDFNAEHGTPILAAADGIVIAAQYHNDYGNMIDIDHGEGLTTRYAHMSRLNVGVGTLVKAGQPIGALGSTGRSTGPHLHFEVRMLGVAQNPAVFLRQGTEFAQVKRR